MKYLSSIQKWLQKPTMFEHTGVYLKPGTKLLDVGCGQKAPYSTFQYYPGIEYSGIDYSDIPGSEVMKHFFKYNIDGNDLIDIPDNYYDVISLSHIIEHVVAGDKLIGTLVKKLKPGGIIYIETPSERSLTLPSWYGTLNFYDDPTHTRVYSVAEMEEVLQQSGCLILKSGKRRSIKRIVLSPLYATFTFARDRKINATVIWDIVGFAHYVMAKKKQ